MFKFISCSCARPRADDATGPANRLFTDLAPVPVLAVSLLWPLEHLVRCAVPIPATVQQPPPPPTSQTITSHASLCSCSLAPKTLCIQITTSKRRNRKNNNTTLCLVAKSHSLIHFAFLLVFFIPRSLFSSSSLHLCLVPLLVLTAVPSLLPLLSMLFVLIPWW